MTEAGRLPLQLFRIVSHVGVWRVIHNGAFYRDYGAEAEALQGACAAAGRAHAAGYATRVVTAAGDHALALDPGARLDA